MDSIIKDKKRYKIVAFDRLKSTNIKAKELAALGKEPWTVVLAKKQTGGYGCKGNEWHSPEGGLYFSIILPKSNIGDLQILTILAAFCVARSIKDLYSIEPFIKLPNDVYLSGKKICGVLTENIIFGDVSSSVIGIGINTNIEIIPDSLDGKGTSLEIELGTGVDNNAILEQIIIHLQEIFKSISQ